MTISAIVPEPTRPGAFRGWALLPVVGTGVNVGADGEPDPFRPDIRGDESEGDRIENVIQAGAGRCLVACDVLDVSRLAGGVVLADHGELGVSLGSISAARRNRIKNALSQMGATEEPGDDLQAFLKRAGRRMRGFEQTFDPTLHLADGTPPSTGSFLVDNFVDPNATVISAHTSDSGHTWTRHPSYTLVQQWIATNRLRGDANTNQGMYYSSAIPAGPEYDLAFQLRCLTLITNDLTGVGWRIDPAVETGYVLTWYRGSNAWTINKYVATVLTAIGTFAQTLTTATDYPGVAEVRDATKKVFLGGVERISSTDNEVTAAGRIATRTRFSAASTGVHLEFVDATDVGGAALSVSPADALGMTDALEVSVGRSIFIDDALGVQDIVAASSAVVRQVDDALAVADNAVPSIGSTRQVDDALAVTDSATPLIIKAISIDDLLAVTDAQRFDRSIGVADQLAIADSVVTQAAYVRSVADQLGLTDQVLTAAGYLRSVDDALAMVDQVSPVIIQLVQLADSLGITDAVGLTRGHERVVTDQLAVADQVAMAQNRVIVLNEDLAIADALTRAAGYLVSVNDLLAIADSISVGSGAGRAVFLELLDRAARLLELSDRQARTLTLEDRPL